MKSVKVVENYLKHLNRELDRLEKNKDTTVLERSNIEILKASYKQKINTLNWVLDKS